MNKKLKKYENFNIINESEEEIKKVLKNTGWLLADKALKLIVGFVVGVWVVRYLGPEQLGDLSYAQAIAAVLAAAATLGMDNIVIREIVKYPDRRNQLLGTSFCMRISFLPAPISWHRHS